ncbi:MAG: hypothetical protein LAT65_07085 [Saccharospirillum sp.]|nr:hypothetical protein [Saccharospirillum sp.]
MKKHLTVLGLGIGLAFSSHACEQSVAEGIAAGNVVIAAQYLPGPDRPTYTRQLIGIHQGLGLSGPAQPLDAEQSGVFYRISVGDELNNQPYEQNRYRLNSTALPEVNVTLYSQPSDSECRVIQIHFDSPDNGAGDVFESLFLSLELELL